ncbi:branched-chain amino acid transport system II carrier protein [Sphingobacterium sp. CZ-2]|uniref:branched-chain amino acid transport system II carrier protein n=1 Tax=Sphingobacterium sp. CZ-2 TaxID=2557994 RepID=UPI00106F7BEF|nr:branched-chain amino acid transport system II carrier protein [Sphingobacterium sp. CZ-2]QBR12159.1 branched-chain amino acid transport system II carrier protein [Sphingobacterium sp. CZ-2]
MKRTRDIITIGFALFAMFFGAGNLLLPPYIGLQIGDHVGITILAFGLTGILLPFFGILSIVNSGEDFNDLGGRVHKNLAPILGSIIMLCIGPMIAIPRTAATTFEVGVLPSFPNAQPIWTSIAFFAVTWLLTIAPSKVVDIIGNFLTPLLLVLLIGLIVVGVMNPIADYSTSALSTAESFTLGFIDGYQTLDVLASVIFAGIIIMASKAKGYKDIKSKNYVVIAAGALAAVCLFIIYGGLIYLGATSGISDPGIKRSELLIYISRSILGDYGTIAIAISIALACLTTAIALTSAIGTFFSELTGNKLGYKLLVTICCVVSCVLSITGVDNIISFAYPILSFVYPIVITLVIYYVFFGAFVKSKLPYRLALAASTLMAVIGLLKQFNLLGDGIIDKLNHIPFFAYDLGWVVPSLIGFVIGILIAGLGNSADSDSPSLQGGNPSS